MPAAWRTPVSRSSRRIRWKAKSSGPASPRRPASIRTENGCMAESEAKAPFALDRVEGWTLHQIAGWGSSTEMDATFARVLGFRPPNAVGATLRRDERLAIRIGPDRLWIV